jgi:hypothetical protein
MNQGAYGWIGAMPTSRIKKQTNQTVTEAGMQTCPLVARAKSYRCALLHYPSLPPWHLHPKEPRH